MDESHFHRALDEVDQASLLAAIHIMMGAALRVRTTEEDLLQETLLQACRDHPKHTYVDPRSFRAWILAIARNRLRDAADESRAQKRGGGRPPASIDDSVAPVKLPPVSTTPSRIAASRERATVLLQALATLPPEQGLLVRAYLIEARPMREVAAEHGVNLSTAWSRFRSGVERFRDEIRARSSRASEP